MEEKKEKTFSQAVNDLAKFLNRNLNTNDFSRSAELIGDIIDSHFNDVTKKTEKIFKAWREGIK